MKKAKIDKLEAERRRIMALIWKREARQRVKTNRAHIGKFYRYRNSYSGGDPWWWLYVAVTGMDADGNLKGWSFQNDTEGRLSIEVGRTLSALAGNENYREIARAEFAQAWKEFRNGLPSELSRSVR